MVWGLEIVSLFPGRLLRFCAFPAVEAMRAAELRVRLRTQDSMVWP